MYKKVFEFNGIAKTIPTKHPTVKKTGVWTDGLSLSSEFEPNWSCAYVIQPNRKYKITIEIEE
jgi:hypothetical protein